MNAVNILGKYLFGIAFLIYGGYHLVYAEAVTALVPAYVSATAWIYVSGLIMVFAGVAVLIRKKDAIATFLIGLLFLVFAFFLHFPVMMDSGFKDAEAFVSFLEDLIIAGAGFMYSRSAAHDRSWRLI